MLRVSRNYRCCLFLSWMYAVFFILLSLVQGRDAVRVECKTSFAEKWNECRVGSTTSLSTIKLLEQDPGSYCVQNGNFFLALNGSSSYVWVMFGCSGVFEVSTPPLVVWGSWGPCSVSCGLGARTRKRSCSTGRDRDCSTLADWSSSVTESCNMGVCKTEPRTGPPLCGFSPKVYRVFGGKAADECEYPWMAMVHKPGTRRRCGGTIVDQTHIITAAHCLSIFDERMLRSMEDKPDTLVVFTGSSYMPLTDRDNPDAINGLTQHTVAHVQVHEDFNPFTLENDIAVLTLSKAIVYDRCTVPVCQIDGSMSVYDANECRTMGWGVAEGPENVNGTNHLQWTSVDIVPEQRCRAFYGSSFFPKNFCAGGNGRDACEGDSGSPLVCKGLWNRYYQYGIVSSGFKDIQCGSVGGQYTSIQKYAQWLERHLV